jgi:hypothetical protein
VIAGLLFAASMETDRHTRAARPIDVEELAARTIT